MTRETSIETRLRKGVKALGGYCIKLNPLGLVGIPDRLLLLPGGRVVFVECKKPKGSRIARMQKVWKEELERLGFRHEYVFTGEDVGQLIGDL